jgi:hypothetical protein
VAYEEKNLASSFFPLWFFFIVVANDVPHTIPLHNHLGLYGKTNSIIAMHHLTALTSGEA